jgi:hypothetical protein
MVVPTFSEYTQQINCLNRRRSSAMRAERSRYAPTPDRLRFIETRMLGRLFPFARVARRASDFQDRVNEYTRRSLTYEGDALDAFWGVLKAFEGVHAQDRQTLKGKRIVTGTEPGTEASTNPITPSNQAGARCGPLSRNTLKSPHQVSSRGERRPRRPLDPPISCIRVFKVIAKSPNSLAAHSASNIQDHIDKVTRAHQHIVYRVFFKNLRAKISRIN